MSFLHIVIKFLLTARGFATVAEIGTEFARLDETKLWKKVITATTKLAIAQNPCYELAD